MQGLVRLAGYRYHPLLNGRGLAGVRWEEVKNGLVVLDPGDLLSEERAEEWAWIVQQIDKRFLQPHIDAARVEPGLVSVIATGPEGGLAVTYQFGMAGSHSLPFDERSLDERGLREIDANAAIDLALTA